ncbi:MAG TPA: ion transporter, partial [Thermoanaerobaculia bacterium]|nr:ion transporter [Thermoanaerobaculia bacterium]
MKSEAPSSNFRHRLHEVIFEADTPAGRRFNLVLLLLILASVAVVLLESVPTVRARYGRELWIVEWAFTILFTIEYLLRLIAI